MKIFAFIFSILILGCNTQQKTTEGEKNTDANINITLLNEGSHGGFDEAKSLVIKTEEELQKIYTKINMIRRPGLPVPKIDWENEMVIAIFMGEKTTGGYSAKVENIIQNSDNSLEVIVNEKAPQGMATMVICQPFYICKVKRNDNEVTFKKVE